jgi:hypothetical protein
MKNLISGHTHIQCKDWPGFTDAVEEAANKRVSLLQPVGKVRSKKHRNATVYDTRVADAESLVSSELYRLGMG